MSRVWPAPTRPERTLHLIGDLHFGAIAQVRADKALADILDPQLPVPVAHVQVGDVVESAQAAQDALAVAWLDQLPAPWHATLGNHDITNNLRTTAQAAASLGMPASNYAVDLGFCRLLVVYPDPLPADNTSIVLGQATRDWLAAELEAHDDCVIVCHSPIGNTVLGATSGADAQFSSAEAGWSVDPDTEVRALLDAHPSAKVWVCGHTHSTIATPGFFTMADVGSREIASVNASALYYVGRSSEPLTDPLRSVYLTWRGDHIELRVRDHGAGVWVAVNGERITQLALG